MVFHSVFWVVAIGEASNLTNRMGTIVKPATAPNISIRRIANMISPLTKAPIADRQPQNRLNSSSTQESSADALLLCVLQSSPLQDIDLLPFRTATSITSRRTGRG